MMDNWCYRLQEGVLVETEREASVPRRGEVQIAVAAVSLNYRDLGILHGHYPATPGIVPLSDGAGIVTAVGGDVNGFAVGDTVVGCFYPFWESGRATARNHRVSLGCEVDGLLRATATLPAEGLVHKPEHLSLAEASTLPCAALTAWSALFSRGGLRPGEHVLVQGTGGVAVFALQFAKAAGAEVTVISSSNEKLERASALGADHLINYRETPAWGDATTDRGSSETIDLVVELGGATTLAQSFRCLKVGGRLSVIGVLSGNKAELSVSDVLRKAVVMKGITVGNREDFIAMNRFMCLHRLHPMIDRKIARDEAPAAYDVLAAGNHFGKIIIDCEQNL